MNHIRALRVLCQVEASGSFTGAAAALGLSQSAVSQHVAGLERVLGIELVERNLRPVAVTAAGHALVAHGRAILARVETAEHELAEMAGRRRSRLRFGTFPSALATFAPAAISQFRAAHPGVTLTIVDDHMQRLIPRLRDRELDLALVYDDAERPGPADLAATRVPLFEDRYQAVLPRGHRLGRRSSSLDLPALAAESWIGGGVDSAWFRVVRSACRRAGFEPDVVVGSDDYHAVLAFAASGLGVAVVPGLAAAWPPPGVVVRPLRGHAPTRRIAAVTPRDWLPSDAAQTMVALLSKTARAFVASRRADLP